MSLTIKKVLNSSVVLCTDDTGNEQIVLGKGIGFGRKSGTEFKQDRNNQVFVPITSPELKQVESMLREVSPKIIEVTRRIVRKAQSKISVSLNKSLTFSLIDHIKFSLDRYKEGLVFRNKLYWEVKSYYPKEFEIGEWTLELINSTFHVELPKEEAASIAFHIINAESQENNSDSMEITQVINSLLNIINLSSKVPINKDSISYQRLVTHIKFFAERLMRGQQLTNEDPEMYEHVVTTYPQATKITIKIMDFLEKKYRMKITDEETTYLIIHIQRNIKFDKSELKS